jgi:hypothetical protein
LETAIVGLPVRPAVIWTAVIGAAIIRAPVIWTTIIWAAVSATATIGTAAEVAAAPEITAASWSWAAKTLPAESARPARRAPGRAYGPGQQLRGLGKLGVDLIDPQPLHGGVSADAKGDQHRREETGVPDLQRPSDRLNHQADILRRGAW